MPDEFEFTLHSPLTEEDWNKLSDAEHENTMFVTFQTPQGRQVRYVKCEVLDKIRAEIKEESRFCPLTEGLERALEIIDKYMAESEKEEKQCGK